MRNKQSGFGHFGIFVIIIVLATVGFVGWYVYNKSKDKNPSEPSSSTSSAQEPKWQTQDVAVAGNYADADAVDIGGGKYRMYYSLEPEQPGFNGQVYSATSTDGIKWTQEDGTRKTMATFPSVIKLADGKWRMYFQNAGVIKSATSSDGLSWQDEVGTRMDGANSLGLNFENVAAPTVEQLSDGSYLMIYRGLINQAYADQVPNKNTQLFLWATSNDGLSWDKKGLAVDSRNSTLQGLADGPELVPKWDDGSVKLFFWSYSGVYYSTFKDGKFSEPKLVYRGQNTDSQKMFPENPPGDPTLAKINGVWNMYFGTHQKGIYRAVLK